MASLLVLVAHSGRTLQLDVQPSTRVDAVQHALVSFTGIPVVDQIAMYQGARLDPSKLLGAYRLPVDPSVAIAEDHPVFLYCRSYLKPGAALPPPEALPPLQVQVPPLAEVNLAHPLHSAPSPLVRALPDYERHFQHHLATTRAYWEVAQARLQRCRQLLSEQEVQARAADAARANVEAHYTYILNSYQSFLVKYNAQHAAHAKLLASFPSDLAALEAIELHPSLRQQKQHAPTSQPPPSSQQQQENHPNSHQQPPHATQQAPSPAGGVQDQPQHPRSPAAASDLGQHQPFQQQSPLLQSQPQQFQRQQQQPHLQNVHPGQQPLAAGSAGQGGAAAAAGTPAGTPPVGSTRLRLADLYPMGRLREWAETCARSHASFGSKVSELEGLFQLLRRDVEGLFMQAPSVDLDALGRQMSEHEALLDEHSSLVQVLSKDLRTVRTLVEDVVRQLGSSAAGGGGGGVVVGGPSGGGSGLRSGALHDAAAAMEAIHETHRNRVLPRLAALDSQLASFAASVEAAKVAMSRDVLTQLQRISGQQSRIRDMKNKLAAFHEVLGRQDAAFGELRVVHRLPAAYRALLAEVVRRSAWHQLYCGQAGRLAEHMARFREKEAARRTAFSSQVSRYLPNDLLARAGLVAEPPYCQVTVPSPAVPLIGVAMADLQRLSYLDERILASSTSAAALRASCAAAAASTTLPPAGPAATAMATAAGGGGARVSLNTPAAAATGPHHPGGGGGGGVLDPGPSSAVGGVAGAHAPIAASVSHHHHHHPHHHPYLHHQHHHHQQQALLQQSAAGSRMGVSTSLPFPGMVAVLDADPAPPTDSVHALEMENARLRAELANHIAAACIRELSAIATTSTGTTTSGGDTAQQQQQQQQQEQHAAEDSASPSPLAVAGTTSRAWGGGAAGAGSTAPPHAGGGGSSPSPAAGVGTGSGGGGTTVRRDPAELVTAMQRALGMKDDLIHQQAREMSVLAARAAAYEERITALEALLAQRAMGTEGESGVFDGDAVGDGRDGSIGGRGAEEGGVADAAALGASGSDNVALGVSGSDNVALGVSGSGVGVGSSIVSGDGGLGAQSLSSGVGSGSALSRGPVTDRLLEEEDRAGVPDDAGAWQLGGGGAAGGAGGPPGRCSRGVGSYRSRSPVLEATATLGHVIHMATSEGLAPAEGAAPAETPPRTSGTAAGARSSPFSILAGNAQEGGVMASEGVQREHLPLSRPGQEQGWGKAASSSGRRESGELERAELTVSAKSGGGSGGSGGAGSGGDGGGEHCPSQLMAASGGTPASLRGSSGPQAIPQASSQGRRGGGCDGGGGVDCPSGSPYEPRVPMSIGSLPFATSLPALSSSVMGGRLASSPSTGIGLGLALGFGLASLAEGQRLGHGGMQGRSAGCSSSGCSSGSESKSTDGTESQITDSGNGGADDSAAALRRSGAPMATSSHGPVRDSRGVGIDSVIASDGGASSSSGLQFQPSWSAPVSGDNGFVHESGSAAGEAIAMNVGFEPVAVAVGIVRCDLGLSGQTAGLERDPRGGGGGGGDDERTAPAAGVNVNADTGVGSAGGHIVQRAVVSPVAQVEGAQARERQEEGGEVSGTKAYGSGSGDGYGDQVAMEKGACIAKGAEHDREAAPLGHGETDDGDSATQGEEGEVPDIDEVFDGDGTWEVTSGGAGAVEEVEAEMLEMAAAAAEEEEEEVSPGSSDVGAGAAPAGYGNLVDERQLALTEPGAESNSAGDAHVRGPSGDGKSPEPPLSTHGFHPVEASSGYESVGSVSSFGAAEEGL